MSGTLYKSAKKGIISLLPKKQKDSRRLVHQRPISLLVTDYKILEKILANRMKPALEHIINEDQKGFLSQRRIHCNIRRILDLIHYTDTEDIPAVILSIDFQKCFVKIEIPALIKALEYFNFDKKFIRWTEIIYADSKSTVINNGYFSKPIEIQRGVKQGGPCSAYYFLVIAEILAIEIRKNPKIQGILVNQILKALGQYADDIDLYLWGDSQNIEAAFSTFEFFSKRTGFVINYEKTTLYRIGSLKNSVAKLYTKNNVSWAESQINVLGVNITVQKEKLARINYTEIIKKVENILLPWTKRGLSIIGKTMILNTLIASLFVYKMSVLPRIPDEYVTKLNDIMNNFLWENKRPKIKLTILQQDKYCGGISLVDFHLKDIFLKIAWVQILETDTFLQEFAYICLHKTMGRDIWNCNIHKKDIQNLFENSFWKDVLWSWSHVNYHDPEEKNQIASQFLWYNSHIKINKQLIFYENGYKEELKILAQMYAPNGELLQCNVICQMFNLSPMQWNSLISAVPKPWKKLMKEGNIEIVLEMFYERFLKIAKPVKYVYRMLNKSKSDIKNLHQKWSNDQHEKIDLDDLSQAFTNVYAITNKAKFRSFQYRLLRHTLILNNRLNKWKLMATDNCKRCEKSIKEDLFHFLWDCSSTKEVWKWVKEICAKIDNTEILELNYQSILLNNVNENPNHIFNFIVLVTKQTMYAKRCKEEKLTKNILESYIDNIRRYESYQAQKNGKITQHIKKWCIINERNEILYNGTNFETNYVTNYISRLN